MNRIKQLEIHKLIKELDYIESDFNYKNEIINEADSDFLKCVNELLCDNPQLKELFEEKTNNKIKKIIEQKQENIDIPPVKIKENKTVKIKKRYRDIVKLTHPDMNNDLKLNDMYLNACNLYKDNDIVGLYLICDKLNISYEYDEFDIDLIISKIDSYKNKILLLESKITWVWMDLKDKKEKDQMILKYIKNQLDD